MSEEELVSLLKKSNVSPKRIAVATWIESKGLQRFIVAVILINAIVLGCETSESIMQRYGSILLLLDKICLVVFCAELLAKLYAYRWTFFKNGWNCFDFFVVGIAFTPGSGGWAVLRTLRVLRVLRLLTVLPQLRRVVAAFVHSIPGLSGVILVMLIFYYTMGVLATKLFGEAFPEWFGSLGKSWYSLFQVMTLESWSMGIVRPVMDVYPWAWAFFVPFIIIATFTILNLFIGIIVSTMQELSTLPDVNSSNPDLEKTLQKIEMEIASLRKQLAKENTRS